jgi:hypothetical protein
MEFALLANIRALIESARSTVARGVDLVQLHTNFEIGRHIVEFEQQGEAAIISQNEHLLLELGKGFLFETRQKRFTFDDDHFFVDLVFYNRLLRCYVLIDLKIGKLAHQDLGQMQMYVNYFDRYVKTDAEAATVGIVLCKRKHEALVEITLPKDANIHAREYQLYLPSKEELQRKLVEWTGIDDENGV